MKITCSSLVSLHLGRVGLALSGGGLRAAFIHLGVLARLAETGALSEIEVISCVSGGSIIGGFYYFLLRQLLETKAEQHITQIDYINIIKHMIKQISGASHVDLYSSILSSFKANWKVKH